MENYPYPVPLFVASPLNASCALLHNGYSAATRLERMRAALGVAYNMSGAIVTCYNISVEYYPCADITGCGGGDGDPEALSWDYQSCTELVSNGTFVSGCTALACLRLAS